MSRSARPRRLLVMKLLVVLMALSSAASAETRQNVRRPASALPSLSAQEKVAALEARRASIMKTFLWVDLGWAAASVGSGLLLREKATGETKWFHNTNVTFGAVSLAFVAAGFLTEHLNESPKDSISLLKSTNRLRAATATLLGLDAAFFVSAAILSSLAPNQPTQVQRNELYGASKTFLVQGAFFSVLHLVTLLSLNSVSDDTLQLTRQLTIDSKGRVGVRVDFY